MHRQWDIAIAASKGRSSTSTPSSLCCDWTIRQSRYIIFIYNIFHSFWSEGSVLAYTVQDLQKSHEHTSHIRKLLQYRVKQVSVTLYSNIWPFISIENFNECILHWVDSTVISYSVSILQTHSLYEFIFAGDYLKSGCTFTYELHVQR